ncbi:DUF4279 domain-containing protein [Xanthomonadaceae bacterium XH05]|nr:DUF4279 domain-containing protein [Xanthomonadaceae bacterium XH05]
MSRVDNEPICQISIYLKGDNIDPQHLTDQLGIIPTRSHRKGHTWITASGKEVVERTGIWVLSIRSPEGVSSALCELASKLTLGRIALRDMTGIEESFIDIFMTSNPDKSGGGTVEFNLDDEGAAAINKIGLPLQFTITFIQE